MGVFQIIQVMDHFGIPQEPQQTYHRGQLLAARQAISGFPFKWWKLGSMVLFS